MQCRGEKGKPGLRAPKRFDESGLYLCHTSSVAKLASAQEDAKCEELRLPFPLARRPKYERR